MVVAAAEMLMQAEEGGVGPDKTFVGVCQS